MFAICCSCSLSAKNADVSCSIAEVNCVNLPSTVLMITSGVKGCSRPLEVGSECRVVKYSLADLVYWRSV